VSRACRATELFGRRLRELRQRGGLTQQDVAGQVGCSQGHMSALEQGERVPSLLVMIRLALALRCRVTDLTRVFDAEDLRSMLPLRSGDQKARRKRGPVG